MVNKENVLNGLIRYVDNEIIPNLSTSGKWIVGTFTTLIFSKANLIYDTIVKNSYLQAIGICNESGMLDIESLCCALKENAQKYGKLSLDIPVVGKFVFSDRDIESIRNYINEVNQ